MILRRLCVALLVFAQLVGCASAGRHVVIVANLPAQYGGPQTIVAHEQFLPDWLLDPAMLKLNYVVKGSTSEVQLSAIAEGERACRIYTDTVRPHRLVAVAINGALYFAAGFVGSALGSLAFPGTKALEYAQYGGAVYGFGGVANGVVTLGGATYTFENCGRELFTGTDIRILQKSPY